jgi:hypothetical protein
MGPAWPDWSSEINSNIAISYGLSYRNDTPENTGDLLGTRMVDEDWTIVNMLLKYYKLGFSRGTEQANFFIREGSISRDMGIEIAEKYDIACGEKYINDFCKYIDITVDEFWLNVIKFTNKSLFDISTGRPIKKFKIGEGLI